MDRLTQCRYCASWRPVLLLIFVWRPTGRRARQPSRNPALNSRASHPCGLFMQRVFVSGRRAVSPGRCPPYSPGCTYTSSCSGSQVEWRLYNECPVRLAVLSPTLYAGALCVGQTSPCRMVVVRLHLSLPLDRALGRSSPAAGRRQAFIATSCRSYSHYDIFHRSRIR
ncbi:hypothetical protein C8Q77DRAFT_105321 [Trametes polyzona]|nr:hypothetical protein C8Q77DRAFT_105321 [Trametes polyzona]